jgi:hypothetical protein
VADGESLEDITFAYDDCLHVLNDIADEWLLFVHGTTLELFDPSPGLLPKGRGDYGAGFYCFLASGSQAKWGVESAIAWARRKAAGNNQTSCLVYVRVDRRSLIALTMHGFDQITCVEAFQKLDPAGVAGFDLVYGPVGKNSRAGKVFDGSKPCQFKFEESGLAKMQIADIRLEKI